MDHHNLALIRGDRKNPSLQGPNLEQYKQLYEYMRRLWTSREKGRYGSAVEPMLQWAKTRAAARQEQAVPCRAGILNAVIYSNGDVSVCENHAPLGNLREKGFWEIWNSAEARSLRESIAKKQCYCTNEVFLWPSITYQPQHLLRAIVGARALHGAKPLDPGEKIQILAEPGASSDTDKLVSIQTSGRTT
jgi:hypothetical protein